MEYMIVRSDDYLEHFGIKGQKHGIRRYQNPDGSLTPEGKERYGAQVGWEARQMYKRGTITKEQYKNRKKTLAGKADVMFVSGRGRRSREFQRRHEKGYKAASTVLSGLSGAAIGALIGGASGQKGSAAVGAILGAGVGATSGYATQAISNKVNRGALKVYDIGKNKKR